MYLYAHCTTAHHGWWEKGAKCPQWDSHWEEGEVFNCILKYKQNTSRNTNRNTRVLFVCTTAQHGWWQKRGEVSTMGRGGRPGRLVPYFIRALCPPHRAYTPCNTPLATHPLKYTHCNIPPVYIVYSVIHLCYIAQYVLPYKPALYIYIYSVVNVGNFFHWPKLTHPLALAKFQRKRFFSYASSSTLYPCQSLDGQSFGLA